MDTDTLVHIAYRDCIRQNINAIIILPDSRTSLRAMDILFSFYRTTDRRNSSNRTVVFDNGFFIRFVVNPEQLHGCRNTFIYLDSFAERICTSAELAEIRQIMDMTNSRIKGITYEKNY